MRGLLFISRVALLCNVCYLISVIGRHARILSFQKDIVSTIVVLGFVAVFVNFFVNIAWLVTVALKKQGLPLSIGLINLAFLLFQIINIIVLQL